MKRIFALCIIATLGACNQPPPSQHASSPSEAPSVVELEPEPILPPESEEKLPESVEDDVSDVVQALQREMSEKKIIREKLWSSAELINQDYHVGTAYNEHHVQEHLCYVLGRLLRQDEHITGTVVTYEPDYSDLTDLNAHELRIMAVSIDNFVAVATSTPAKSRDERIIEWNLDCVGRYGIPSSAGLEPSKSSSFYLITNDGKVLQILGDIEKGFAKKVIDAIEANSSVQVVALGSGGGFVTEALTAGRYIRSRGLETSLWNNCYSACPLVYIGGVARVNWSPYGDLGFHEVADEHHNAVPLDHPIYKAIFDYATEMGVDPRYVLKRMWSSPPNGMTMVEGQEDELCDAGIITWVQRGCSKPD